jgi:hypothetical protein
MDYCSHPVLDLSAMIEGTYRAFLLDAPAAVLAKLAVDLRLKGAQRLAHMASGVTGFRPEANPKEAE